MKTTKTTKRTKFYDPAKYTPRQIEFARFVDAQDDGTPRDALCAMARAIKNPENRRRAMKTLGIETPAQKRESAERSRAFNAWIGSVTDAEIARNCQFPAAPSKRR